MSRGRQASWRDQPVEVRPRQGPWRAAGPLPSMQLDATRHE
jgi:hypothetical protein